MQISGLSPGPYPPHHYKNLPLSTSRARNLVSLSTRPIALAAQATTMPTGGEHEPRRSQPAARGLPRPVRDRTPSLQLPRPHAGRTRRGHRLAQVRGSTRIARSHPRCALGSSRNSLARLGTRRPRQRGRQRRSVLRDPATRCKRDSYRPSSHDQRCTAHSLRFGERPSQTPNPSASYPQPPAQRSALHACGGAR